jgi:hypothetical protein
VPGGPRITGSVVWHDRIIAVVSAVQEYADQSLVIFDAVARLFTVLLRKHIDETKMPHLRRHRRH